MENEPEMPDLSASAEPAADESLRAARPDTAGPLDEPESPVAQAVAESEPEAADPAPAAKQGESWVETVKTIFYALLIALVIRTFLFQPFNIPSASMESTLLVGDYLFVEKFAYGYSRNSFPFRGWPARRFRAWTGCSGPIPTAATSSSSRCRTRTRPNTWKTSSSA